MLTNQLYVFGVVYAMYPQLFKIIIIFIGFYTKMLMPASIVGVVVFVYGIFVVDDNRVV